MPKVMINGVSTDVSLEQILQDDGLTPFNFSTPPPNGAAQTFSADDIARVRSEEKDKLYGQINHNNEELTTLREQVGSLTAAEQRREAQLKQEQEQLQAEARKKEEEELDTKDLLRTREQEWNQRLETMNQTWEQRFEKESEHRRTAEAVAQREREFGDLRDYTLVQVEANKDRIAPQLREWITGNNQEEINIAVQRAIKSTDEIAAEMQQTFGGQQNSLDGQVAGAPTPPALPGTRATGGPGNTDPSSSFQQLTAEQITNMPMDQFAKLRSQLGIGGQSNNRGLFG